MPSASDTMTVLRWAKKAAASNETVKKFWDKLCDAVNQDQSVSPEKIMQELREYGSNTLLMPFRDEPVPYHEVAYDVAKLLKPYFSEGDQFTESDMLSCERFVLKKMSVTEADIEKLCDAVNALSQQEAALNMSKKVVGASFTASGAGAATAQVVGRTVSQKVMHEAAKKAASKAAKKAAERAAAEMAKQVTARILLGLNVVMVGWAVVSVAGPATRVTIPGVTYVALLRKMYARAEKGI